MKNLELLTRVLKNEMSILTDDINIACKQLGINPEKQFSEEETNKIFEIVNKPKLNVGFSDLLKIKFQEKDAEMFNKRKSYK